MEEQRTSPSVNAARVTMTVCVALAILRLAPARDPAPRSHDCRDALMVDGLLVCDGAAAIASRTCGEPPRPGDRLETRDCGFVRVGRMTPEDIGTLALPVDLNVASPAELASLPGIGPVLASRIVERRPFLRVDELDEVPGVGVKRLAAVRARARVHPPARGE